VRRAGRTTQHADSVPRGRRTEAGWSPRSAGPGISSGRCSGRRCPPAVR
jgi:hypothetical protein